MQIELKPCPFCGGPANYHLKNWGDGHVVRCSNQGCCEKTSLHMSGETREDVFHRWNTRHEAKASGQPDECADDLKLRVGLFLGQFEPARDGNYTQPMSMVPDKHIKAFADFIRDLPSAPVRESGDEQCSHSYRDIVTIEKCSKCGKIFGGEK